MTRIVTILAALALGLTGALASAEGYGPQKVVYHINYDGESGTSYRAAMNNIQNHINAVGAENMEIKVVLHGNGVGLLKGVATDDRLMTTVASLKSQNVRFHVCANTLRGRDIDYAEDLYDVWEEDIVPSGVAELSKLQQDGFTYIKP